MSRIPKVGLLFFRTRHLRNPRYVLGCVSLFACFAAALISPVTPDDGRVELALSPIWLGTPLVVLCGIHEIIVRGSKASYVSFVSAMVLLMPVGHSVLTLVGATFTPAAERDWNTWHLWTLFAVMEVGFLSIISLVFALLA